MEIIAGIEFKDLILLLKQLGLAIMGAAALWGFIFSIRDSKHTDSKRWIIDDWISIRIFNLFLFGTVLATICYFILIPTINALAHEGIAVKATTPEIIATIPLMSVLYAILLFLSFIMIRLQRKDEEKFSYLLTPFYLTSFLLAMIMTSFSAWRGMFDNIQIFHFMHGFHSIFTLGSVIVLDFLFLISSNSELLKQHIYKMFPVISKVIWVGLSFDFISVFLISDHFVVTEKFLFTQTVIAILIINGVILSGPIARKMMKASIEKDEHITKNWRNWGNVCGALSITSWITITSLDFFTNLNLNYGQLLITYLTFFIIAFVGHIIFEEKEKRRSPLTLASDEI